MREHLNLVKEKRLAKVSNSKSKVFFHKMAGDYCRKIANSAQGAKLEEIKKGLRNRTLDLGACGPIRVNLALNFLLFNYKVKNDKKNA